MLTVVRGLSFAVLVGLLAGTPARGRDAECDTVCTTAGCAARCCLGQCEDVHEQALEDCTTVYACLTTPLATRDSALSDARETRGTDREECAEADGAFDNADATAAGGCTETLLDCLSEADRTYLRTAGEAYRDFRKAARTACGGAGGLQCLADVRRRRRQCAAACRGSRPVASRPVARVTPSARESTCQGCEDARSCKEDCQDSCGGNAVAERLCLENCADKNCDALGECDEPCLGFERVDCTQTETTTTTTSATTSSTRSTATNTTTTTTLAAGLVR